MLVHFAVVLDECNGYLIDKLSIFADVFRWAQRGLKTLGKHCNLLVCLDSLHADVLTPEEHVQSVEGHVMAQLKTSQALQSETDLLEAATDVVYRHLHTIRSVDEEYTPSVTSITT